MKILFIVLIYSSFCWPDTSLKELSGFDPKTDIVADNYEAGSFLIYDCEEKHWVCVTEPYFKECEIKRDKVNEKSFHHLCAPIGEFPTKKSCFQRQLFMTSQNHGTRFCVKDGWKNRNIRE